MTGIPFHTLTEQQLRSRFRGCLLGGAVGDALGAPVEFKSRAAILARFGPQGIQEYVPAFGRLGAVTDDTQMTLFTTEGLLRQIPCRSHLQPKVDSSDIAFAYQRWLHTQGMSHPMHDQCIDGWLIGHQELFDCRAPGNTCISALVQMKDATEFAENNSKGCGGVMRVAPVGMYYAALAESGFCTAEDALKGSFETGCEAAGITHGHPTGKLASGAFAAIIFLLLRQVEISEAIKAVLPLLQAQAHHQETTSAIVLACQLARDRPSDAATLERLGGGWTAEEALAISIYCALSERAFRSGVELSVNHSGDSDSTGSMVGQLLGATFGVQDIPLTWLDSLELRAVIEEMADDMLQLPEWGGHDPLQTDIGMLFRNKYPVC